MARPTRFAEERCSWRVGHPTTAVGRRGVLGLGASDLRARQQATRTAARATSRGLRAKGSDSNRDDGGRDPHHLESGYPLAKYDCGN